ncbi:MAG: hypothetical protein NVSMB17_19140 [Candidatus Dormibacteria bacterium]
MKYRALLMVAALVGLFSASTGARAAASVHVLQGSTYKTMIFPNNALTTSDSSQLTGLRVNFREGIDYPACDATNYSVCDAFGELNRIDGFDIQPRVVIPLDGNVKLDSIDDGNFYITDAAGAYVSAMRQLTFDPVTHTLAGISDKFLKEGTTYRVRVESTIKDTSGTPIDACGGRCDVIFTTRNASRQLVSIRDALDSGAAYTQAGITDRKASFTQNGTNDVFLAPTVGPSLGGPAMAIQRIDNAAVSPADPNYMVTRAVPNLVVPGTAGYYAFGSFESPRYQYRSPSLKEDTAYTATSGGPTDGEISPVPTTRTPPALGKDRLGLIVITPNPVLFPPPWPAAVYGPGFTRSKFDIFVTADYNASLGIATLATDPAGHGYGPQSKITVTTGLGTSTTFSSYGRGRDLDGDGCIGAGLLDGVGPTDHKSAVTGNCGPDQVVGSDLPSHKPIDGVQSGLVQTVVDNMALVRSIEAGMTIPGAGDLKKTDVMYYGLSFGGIYGTMLAGTDSHVKQALLNVPGGPIVDIARLSSFRGNLRNNLKVSKPNMLNGGPGLEGFTEDLPLRSDPSQVITHPGALALQELFGLTNWYNRSGSPETFAPRIRLRPDPLWRNNPKNVVFQTAYGDQTVPNPTAGTLYRAGELFDRVVYYRNDKTPTFAIDPHGWLADPSLAGRTSGEQQLGAFLATGQLVPTNPAFLETPVVDPNNLECLHYPDPQSGMKPNPQPFPLSGSCATNPHGGTPPTTGSSDGSRPANPGGPGSGPGGLPNTAALDPGVPARAGEALLLAVLAALLLVAGGRRRRRQPAR